MADTNLLAQLLAGGPLAPQQLGGYQGAQLQDAALNPAFAHNEGPFGALAKTIAGFSGGPMLRQSVEATTAARQAANPDLAKLLAANDPFAALAANPGGFNPVAAGTILQGATPSSAAEARLHAAQAALANANAAEINSPAPARIPLIGGGSPGGGTRASGGASPTPFANVTGRPAPVDSLDEIGKLAPEERAAALAKITDPRARAILAAKLRQKQMQNAPRP